MVDVPNTLDMPSDHEGYGNGMTDEAASASLQPEQVRSEGDSFAPESSERGTFPLQARAELRSAFAYLQARERADYYQAIVRVFLKHARRYYRIYLTLDELAAELIPLYSDYSAEKCRVDLAFDKMFLPHYEVPEGQTPDSYLETLCRQGLRRRYGAEAPKCVMPIRAPLRPT